jgi:hypothetical protein
MIFIIIGHYGSGKTNFACNLALKLALEGSTAIADLDIVNPYFRTADYTETLKNAGVAVIASDFQTSTLDIPALNFDLEAAAAAYDNLIIDVGGDDEGAKALGRYQNALADKPVNVMYVVNFRRYLTHTAEDALVVLREIEAVARVKANILVNNTNLAEETTSETVTASLTEFEKLSALTGITDNITVVPEGVKYQTPNTFTLNPFTVRIIVKKPWG